MKEDNAVRIERQGGVSILHIRGDVTRRSEDAIRSGYDQVDPEKEKKILLQFDEAIYFNSEGLKIIILLLAESRKHQQEIAVTGLSEHFRKIFRMVGITKFARIFDSANDAIAALEAAKKTGEKWTE
jgi:anti-anti-sigma factor